MITFLKICDLVWILRFCAILMRFYWDFAYFGI